MYTFSRLIIMASVISTPMMPVWSAAGDILCDPFQTCATLHIIIVDSDASSYGRC